MLLLYSTNLATNATVVFKLCSMLITTLKELKNCILCTILAWSLFCLIWLYVGLHFLRFLLENQFFVFLYFFQSRHQNMGHMISSFVLTLYKNLPFTNNKLFTKVLQYYEKACFQRCSKFFNKKLIKRSVGQSKN